MLALADRLEVREATVRDLPAIMAMRERQEREFIGQVEVPVNVTWFVAVRGGERVVACAGVSYATQRKVIITDFLDDGTYGGRRGLARLIRDALAAHAKLFISVPFDRPELRWALERRGIVFKAWHGEYPA